MRAAFGAYFRHVRPPRFFKVFLIVTGVAAVLSLALSFWLSSTESGRRWVANRLESVISDAIPGKIEIGQILDIGPPVVAKDVRFFHPDGRVVLLAKHAEIVLSLSHAVQGQLGFERAAVNGGFIVLSPDPDGRIAMEAAMNAPSKPGQPSDPMGGLHYALMSMHVENFEVVMKLAEQADFKLKDVKGFVGVRRIETPGTRVTLDKISGRLADEILGKKIELSEVNGWIHGKAKQIVHMDTVVKIGEGKLNARIEFFDREKTPAIISIRKATEEGDFVEGLLDLLDGIFGDALEVKTEGDKKDKG